MKWYSFSPFNYGGETPPIIKEVGDKLYIDGIEIIDMDDQENDESDTVDEN